jgi:hypothetical protein
MCAQVVLSSQLCDVTAAAALKDPTSSCRVLYNSAAYLSTIAHRLNIPVEVQQGLQYCYPLPAAAGAAPQQHCQVSNKRGVTCSAAVITVCVLVLCGGQHLLLQQWARLHTRCHRTLSRQTKQARAVPQPPNYPVCTYMPAVPVV